jgi:hypothetical protein
MTTKTVGRGKAVLGDATRGRQLKCRTRRSFDHRGLAEASSHPARIIEINWQTEPLQIAPHRHNPRRLLVFCSFAQSIFYYILAIFPHRSGSAQEFVDQHAPLCCYASRSRTERGIEVVVQGFDDRV